LAKTTKQTNKSTYISLRHILINYSVKKMIYAFKAFIQLLFIVSAMGIITFPLEKRGNHEFVAGILSRASRGMKYV
jgi:hypothetical protein